MNDAMFKDTLSRLVTSHTKSTAQVQTLVEYACNNYVRHNSVTLLENLLNSIAKCKDVAITKLTAYIKLCANVKINRLDDKYIVRTIAGQVPSITKQDFIWCMIPKSAPKQKEEKQPDTLAAAIMHGKVSSEDAPMQGFICRCLLNGTLAKMFAEYQAEIEAAAKAEEEANKPKLSVAA